MIKKVEVKRAGLTLRGILERKTTEKCPAVILFHGFSGDIGCGPDDLFQKISNCLTEQGMAVIRFDFNGHGESDGAFEDMNLLNELDDAITILSFVRKLDFVTDIYVIGHSQGGVVGGMLCGYYPDVIKKLVLLAPAATLKKDALKGVCMGTHYDTNAIPDSVSLNGGQLTVGGHYFRIAKNMPIYEVTGKFKQESLAIHGKMDMVVDPEASVMYSQTMKNCKLELYDGLDHGLNGEEQKTMIEHIVCFLEGKSEQQ